VGGRGDIETMGNKREIFLGVTLKLINYSQDVNNIEG